MHSLKLPISLILILVLVFIGLVVMMTTSISLKGRSLILYSEVILFIIACVITIREE